MKYVFYSVLCLFILCQTVTAEGKNDAENLIKSKLDTVIMILKNNTLPQEEKDAQIIDILTPVFDFQKMAMLTLGKKYWPGLTDDQKNKFTDLFIKRLKESVLEKLNLYTNEAIAYKDSVDAGGKVQVPTDLISKNNTISMVYKLYDSQKGWLVYDIEIEGVSIISTYRSQFDQVLSTGTIDDLFMKLEKPENA